jgi:3-oxoacyl-[acyl-carrier protein] reductase
VRLEGKVALVTGAAAGFGEAMATTFIREGAKVAIVDLNGEAADRLADKLGDAAIGVAADVSDGTAVAAMVRATTDAFGRLDIVVNNAGFSHRNGPLDEVSEADFDRIFAVNAKAIYLAAKAVIPIMEAQGGGTILTTASTAGLRPRPGLAWYNASKGWAITATKSMAVELAAKNIRVNCLCPVASDTAMLPIFLGEDTPEKRRQFRSTVPLGRFSYPSDVANAALYLVCDEAEFITGVALEVDGGRCI